MPKKKSRLKKIATLKWEDLEDWAGPRIVDRGRRYQQQGRVTDLAITSDENLVAWVDGSER